ncbi:MAG: hypothetical protein ACRERD_07175 [Candidatus Binatia bacterium]
MSAARKTHPETDLAAIFLELYPIVHYRLGMRYEDSLRCGQLTRKQVAILQFLRSGGGPKGCLRRKEIEQWLASWFEVSSATITRSLYALASPPLNLVQIIQDSHSDREKQVILTLKGKQFLTTMAEQGRKFLQPLFTRVPEEVIRNGLDFMKQSIAAIEEGRTRHR